MVSQQHIKEVKMKEIPFDGKCKDTAANIIICALIALLSCLAETPFGAVNAVIAFAGELAVLMMFTLYFAMTAEAFSKAYPERRARIFCIADCAALVLKITFAALCTLAGDVLIHAAALIADAVISRVYNAKLAQHKTDPERTGSV